MTQEKLHIFGVSQFILRFFFFVVGVQCSRFHTWLWRVAAISRRITIFVAFVFRIMGFLKNRMSWGGAPLTLFCTDRSHFCSVSLSYRIHIFKCTLLHFSSCCWCIFPPSFGAFIPAEWTLLVLCSLHLHFLIYYDFTKFFFIFGLIFCSHQKNVHDNHWTASF